MGKSPRGKILIWETPQEDKFPRVQFEFRLIKIVVGGFGGPKKWAKAPK
jgi:hypothetical protein